MFSCSQGRGGSKYHTCMHAKSLQLRLTLWNLMVCSLSGCSVHGDSPGKNTWSGLPFPSPGDLPNPGIEPRSPSLQADSSLSEPPGKLQRHIRIHQIHLLNHLTHCQKYLVNSDSSPILTQGERKKKQDMIKNLGINNIWIFALYRRRFNWLFSSPILVPWPGSNSDPRQWKL